MIMLNPTLLNPGKRLSFICLILKLVSLPNDVLIILAMASLTFSLKLSFTGMFNFIPSAFTLVVPSIRKSADDEAIISGSTAARFQRLTLVTIAITTVSLAGKLTGFVSVI